MTVVSSACAMQRDKSFRDGFDDLLVDFIDAQIAFDHHDTVWFPTGDFAVLFPHALEELALLLLEAVFILAGLCSVLLIAPASADEACVEGRQQKQRDVRLKVSAYEAVEFEDAF